jgi:hypothetical protein
LLRWLDAATVAPLAPDLVPGADETERTRLAALGAVAAALAPEAVASWPESLAAWAEAGASLPLTGLDRDGLLDDTGGDLLALTYEWAVSGINRRRLGTFFTPAALVDHMITAASAMFPDGGPALVADPGAGVGAFSRAARRRWPDADVAAVDVNVVTLGLLAARLHADGQRGGEHVRLLATDYLAWLTEGWPTESTPRLILGNPPYTRHQHLTAKEKQDAREAAGDLISSGLAGLSAYFLAASLRALEPDDGLCLLLPGSWCETRYGREIRQWLWASRNRRVTVEFFPSRVEVFPGTQVTAMVLLVGPAQQTSQPFAVVDADLTPKGVQVMRTVTRPRTDVCPATFTELLRDKHAVLAGAEPLSEHATIRRGVATGASEFFFLTDAQKSKHRLPAAALRPALVKPRHTGRLTLTEDAHEAIGRKGHPRWLLDLNEDPDLANSRPSLVTYLATGRAAQIHERYLPRQRPEWFIVEPVNAPDLFLAPVGKDSHRVIVNTVGAVGSNNFYGIYLKEVAPWTAAALATWMRSLEGQEALASLARHYQGGSLKIEPRALRGLMVPPALNS